MSRSDTLPFTEMQDVERYVLLQCSSYSGILVGQVNSGNDTRNYIKGEKSVRLADNGAELPRDTDEAFTEIASLVVRTRPKRTRTRPRDIGRLHNCAGRCLWRFETSPCSNIYLYSLFELMRSVSSGQHRIIIVRVCARV